MSADVLRFPFERTISALANDPRVEWLFHALDGHPNPAKKRLILEARATEVGFIDDRTAAILIDALGLAGF